VKTLLMPTSLLSVMATLMLATAVQAQDPSAVDCNDFATQPQAQAFFEAHNTRDDPYMLDPDGDLVACEVLPGESTSATANATTPATTTAAASPTAGATTSASPTITVAASPTASATALPRSGGGGLLLMVGALLVGSGVLSYAISRRV
jgi:hypothetical protein